MIFPFLKGILSFRVAPVTWLLFFINACMFLVTQQPLKFAQDDLDHRLKDDYFVESQGRLYAQFIEDHPESYSPMMLAMSDMALQGNAEKIKLLGTLAIRNTKFLSEGPTYPFRGDQVAVGRWVSQLREIREVQGSHPNFVWGLNSEDTRLEKWLSYIFVHSGAVHFAGNMLFLLIFGCVLEPLIGGLTLLIVFLGSGMIAAGTFLLVTGASSAPLIGASGAVSGLMALYSVLFWRRPVRYFYWLFIFKRGYAGFVYLPAWIILATWLAQDLAGYWSSVAEFGGIAYTAHLGGEFAGALVAAILFLLPARRLQKKLPPAPQLGATEPMDFWGRPPRPQGPFLKNNADS